LQTLEKFVKFGWRSPGSLCKSGFGKRYSTSTQQKNNDPQPAHGQSLRHDALDNEIGNLSSV
jgi:hypothetical protein